MWLRQGAISGPNRGTEESPIPEAGSRTRSRCSQNNVGEASDLIAAYGWFQPRTRAIVLIDTGNRAQILKTLVHETAHAILHGQGDHHDTPTKEIEAESVAFIVSHVLGLDTGSAYSFPYIASWASGDDATKRVRASGERITRAARSILDALLGPVEEPELEAVPEPLSA